MQTDIKKRLEEERDRHVAGYPGPRRDVAGLLDDALSALLSLSARVGELEKALEPFSKFAGPVFERNFNKPDTITSIGAADGGYCTLTAGDFFAARAALTHPAPTHEDGGGERLTPEQVADHIGVTPYSDMRPFVVQAVRYAREKDALSHTSGEVTEAMVQRALASLAKEIEMPVPMRSPMYRALEAALRGDAS